MTIHREACPCIVVRQQKRHIIGWLALAQRETHSLQIPCQVRHDEPPRIMGVKGSCRVHSPSRFPGGSWRVRPPVPYQLIDALKKVQVGFCLHVERCCSKSGGVQPRPRFRRNDRLAKQVAGGGWPRGVRETPPQPSLSL